MQTPDLGADECLDPALMSAFEDGAVDPFGQWHCGDPDAGPPSPFDLSTIDPDLLALYPEHKDNSSTSPPAASSGSLVPFETQNLSLSPPPLREESSALSMTSGLTTDNTESRTHHDSLRPGPVEERADDEAASSAARSESPPPIWIPPRASTSLPDAHQLTSSTTTDARDARSSETAPRPRVIMRIPSLATRPKSPGPKSAPPAPGRSQKRGRSPTPDSEEDDFAASFMRKRRVLAGLL